MIEFPLLRELEKEIKAVAECLEKTRVQLAGCSVAALGHPSAYELKPDAYGWSASFKDVLDLRVRYERLLKAAEALNNKLDQIWDDSSFKEIHRIAAGYGVLYTGPKCTDEQDALRAALEEGKP